MRSLIYFIIFLPLLVSAVPRHVHFYRSASYADIVGRHSGTSAGELRSGFVKTFSMGTSVPKCPFFPIAGHYGGYNYAPIGGQAIWCTYNGFLFYGQCNNILTDGSSGENAALRACSGCVNSGYLLHTIQVLQDGNPANKAWLWDESLNNPLVRSVSFTYDEAGNITGYSAPIDESKLPYGAIVADIDKGIAGNGTILVNDETGPYWAFNNGVFPPLNPEVISGLNNGIALLGEKLDGVNNNLTMLDGSLALIDSSVSELQSLQKDYTSNFASLGASVDAVRINGEVIVSGLQPLPIISSRILDLNTDINAKLNDISGKLSGVVDASLAVPFDLSMDVAVVAADNAYEDSLNRVVSIFEGVTVFGEDIKSLAFTVIGQWRSLPRVLPDKTFSFVLPLLGRFDFSLSSYLSSDFWDVIRWLRACEVIGMFIWVSLKITKLLMWTFSP